MRTVVLQQQGLLINRKRVQRLMRLMRLEGMAPGPNASRPHMEHPRFPYLLRHLEVVRPDQVWASDINTDQGAQYTAIEWVAVLLAHEVRVSMDGKGRWMDNVFVERLWRSLKYEAVYPRAYADVHEAWAGIRWWLHFYNHQRPHQALGYQTPMHVYRTGPDALAA